MNSIMDFQYHGHDIIRAKEEVWLSIAKACQWGNSLLSEETTKWLDFQALIRRILSDFLNGISVLSLWNQGDWIHYFTGKYRWWRISLSLRDMHLLKQMGLSRFQHSSIDIHTLTELLKESEEILTKIPEEIPLQKKVIKVDKDLSRTNLSGLQKYCKGVDDYFSLYIHGSKATGDDTLFSDIDDFLILHTDAWQDTENLKHVAEITSKIARIFQNTDPLQHHGHWVYSELDLLCFDESIIPLIVLNSAITICGHCKLKVAIRQNQAGFRKILWTIIQEVRRDTLACQVGKINLYWLKNLVSGISLLPALTFQVLGQMIDKKNAISRACEIYSERAYEAILWASEIRKNWAEMPTYKYLPFIKLVTEILAPMKRHMAELLTRRLLPSIPPNQIDKFEKVFPYILTLTDESANRLEEVVLHGTI